MCSGPFRQHNSNSIYLSSGRNWVSSAVLQNLGYLAVGYPKQNNFESSSHSRKIEHSMRPVEQNSDMAIRVDLERYSVEAFFQIWGVTMIDLFASYLNKKMAIFCTWDHHPLAYVADAFFVTWNQMFAYAFLPICLIPKVLKHMKQGHCQVILIAPQWLKRHWYLDLLQLCIANPIKLPVTHNLLSQPNIMIYHLDPKVFNLNASWRAGAQKDYSGKFKLFSRLCHGKHIDTYLTSLTECAEFLSFLFHKGLQYRTIAGYRSM